MTQNRFDPLSKDKNVRLSSNSSKETNSRNKMLGGLKLTSININSIRDTKLDLLAFLEVHQPHVVAIQDDGWMDDMRFYVLSTVFQSYQDDGQMIMKGCVQWNPVYG